MADDFNNKLKEVQQKINYKFKNVSMLRKALTHKSYANEQQLDDSHGNERFEFLGDAVLELAITHILMERFRELAEGRLSKLRAAIVNTDCLAGIAQEFGLGRYVLLGRGEDAGGGRKKKSVMANVYEAIIAAVYCDGGFKKAFNLINQHFKDRINEVEKKGFFKDYKSRLQEYSQSAFGVPPEYILTSAQGPDHEKVFTVKVVINEKSYETGRGGSKKSAEQEAARKTIKHLRCEQPE
jgi:ribonuclease III